MRGIGGAVLTVLGILVSVGVQAADPDLHPKLICQVIGNDNVNSQIVDIPQIESLPLYALNEFMVSTIPSYDNVQFKVGGMVSEERGDCFTSLRSDISINGFVFRNYYAHWFGSPCSQVFGDDHFELVENAGINYRVEHESRFSQEISPPENTGVEWHVYRLECAIGFQAE